jgi:hypothetical protein
MFHGVKAGAFREGPARENSLCRTVKQKLVHLDERGGLRRLGWRVGVAGAGGNPERTEGLCLPHLDLKRRNLTRDLIQRRELRERIWDFVDGSHCLRRGRGRKGNRKKDGVAKIHNVFRCYDGEPSTGPSPAKIVIMMTAEQIGV